MLFVDEVMTTNIITLGSSDTLKSAREIMNKSRIRHLPVKSPGGFLVGILTHRDLLNASISLFAEIDSDMRNEIEANIPVSEVMVTNVTTISPGMPLQHAAELMLSQKFGCLPVVDDGILLGILTRTDFVRLCLTLLGCKGTD